MQPIRTSPAAGMECTVGSLAGLDAGVFGYSITAV